MTGIDFSKQTIYSKMREHSGPGQAPGNIIQVSPTLQVSWIFAKSADEQLGGKYDGESWRVEKCLPTRTILWPCKQCSKCARKKQKKQKENKLLRKGIPRSVGNAGLAASAVNLYIIMLDKWPRDFQHSYGKWQQCMLTSFEIGLSQLLGTLLWFVFMLCSAHLAWFWACLNVHLSCANVCWEVPIVGTQPIQAYWK